MTVDGQQGPKLWSFQDLHRLPQLEWLVDPFITQRGFSVIYGPPGQGKTFLALHFALSIVSGQTFAGHTCMQGPVVYVAAEGMAGIAQRLKAWEHRYGRKPGSLKDFYFLPEPLLLRDPRAVDGLIDTVKPLAPKLIQFDTLALCMAGGDENSTQHMGEVIHAIKRIQRETGAAVMLVHHSGKNPSAKERGSSALRGAADTMILVEHSDHDTRVQMSCQKQKDAAKFNPVVWRLEKVEEHDSCVLVFDRLRLSTQPPAPAERTKGRTNPSQHRRGGRDKSSKDVILHVLSQHPGELGISEIMKRCQAAGLGIGRPHYYTVLEALEAEQRVACSLNRKQEKVWRHVGASG